MSDQALLLDQSLEMLISQMMYLDFESLESLCQTSPDLVSICNDERLWRKKIEIDFPDFDLRLPTDSTYRETFRLLSRAETLPIVKKDRIDILSFLHSRGDVDADSSAIGEAVRSRSKQVLRFLLLLPDLDQSEGVVEAVRSGDIELLTIFLESGVYPSALMISYASLHRDLEALRLITDRIEGPAMRDLIGPLVTGFVKMSEDERRQILEIANSLNARHQVSVYEQASLAVLNNDPVRLAEILETPFSTIATPLVEYVYREGDLALVQLLIENEDDPTPQWLASLPVPRLRQLASLGVTSNGYDIEIYGARPDVFLRLVDGGIIDPNVALAYVSSLGDVELIDGLLERRDELKFDLPGVLNVDIDYHLPSRTKIDVVPLRLFGLYY